MAAKSSSNGEYQPRGVISLTELYTLEEAKRRLGWTDSAYRAAKRRGLQPLRSGKQRFISGSEILRFLEQETQTHTTSPATNG